MSPIKNRFLMCSLTLIAFSLMIAFLSACSDDSATEPEPEKPVFTEAVYDDIVTIGDEEAPSYWDEREQLGRAQAIQNLSDRLAGRADVSQVFPPSDVLLFYEHTSGILSAIATDTIPDSGKQSGVAKPAYNQGGKVALGSGALGEPDVIIMHGTLFKYPAWFGIPIPGTPPAKIKTELDNADHFGPITLLDFSYDNLNALRNIPEISRIIYFIPHHGDGDVFQHGRCGTIGPFMQLDRILAWEDLDAATQKDVDACRILIVQGTALQEIWLTNRFLTHYFKGFTKSPLVMISACNLLTNPGALWNSLSGGGAGALVGYTGSMSLGEASDWEPYLVNQLVNDKTLAEAVQAVHNEYAPSQILTYDGEGGWVLAGAWEVVATNPPDGATNVPVTTLVGAYLGAEMNPATVTSQTFTIYGVSGTVAYAEQSVVFSPSGNLDWDTTYMARITTGMEDIHGNSLDADYTWTFRTATDPGSSCVDVREGEWEFCLMNEGNCFLQFVDGELTQTNCFVSYDDDSIFAGPVAGSTWSGENTPEMFRFSGNFYGNPAESFSGTLTLTDGSGHSVEMIGHYGSIPGTAGEAGVVKDSAEITRGVREKLGSLFD